MLNLAVLPEDNALARGAVAGGAVRLTYAEPDTAARQCTPPAATAQSPRQQHSSARRRTGRGPMHPARTDAHPMRDDWWVTDLVTRARTGEKQAWDALVERYAPLIWSVCRRYRLGGADAGDVGQTVWLRLLEQLDKIRDPAALPGWLATTTQRECGRVLRAAWRPQALGYALEAGNIPDGQTGTAEHELLLAERNAALREAFMRLAPGRPAADRHADPRPSGAVRQDQRRAGHPGREHRADPPPLPGEAAPRSGHRCLGRRRSRAGEVR